jgi:hypothetical protein
LSDETKHSSGPWTAEIQKTSAGPRLSEVLGADGVAVLEMGCGCCAVRDRVRPADVALIIAAPDMLAALKMAERVLSGGPISITNMPTNTVTYSQERDLPVIRAAIAKAEGRS